MNGKRVKKDEQQNGIYAQSRQRLKRHFVNVSFAGVQCRLTIGVES